MKLIFRQYLASLRERKELDAVLPDLLSELDYTVISRPSVGTRQYGVDVAALSPKNENGEQKLYLFSIKQGDLTRADWDGGTPQALRSSINEIIDFYIPTLVPKAYEKHDIVICLCFGGDIQEAVRPNVTVFTNQKARQGLTFEEWNGDRIAGLLVQGILREQLVNKTLRSSFQKAVAMVDEPEVAETHFVALIRGLCDGANTKPKQRITILRQLYVCLWVLFVWARDAQNLEAPFRASERTILHAWHLVHDDIASDGKHSAEIGMAFSSLVDLHFIIWDALVDKKIMPFVGVEHAISNAVRSASSIDINLKLFETLGRLSFRGLYYLWSESGDELLPVVRDNWELDKASAIAQNIVYLIENNPVLLAPISDAQTVDITTTLLFLSMMNERAAAKNYVEALIDRVTFAYKTHNSYPTIYGDYRSLLHHPRERTEEYQKAQTKGSTLFPVLSLWATALGAKEIAAYMAQFIAEELQHCTMQLWLAGADTEEKLYTGNTQHGLALTNIPITEDGEVALKILEDECASSQSFAQLSATQLGHWIILVLACRHYRLPLPPNLWLNVLKQLRNN